MGKELVGERLSRGTNQLGTNCGEPNVQGPYVFGTKCVTAVQLEAVYLEALLYIPNSALQKRILWSKKTPK